MSTTDAADVPLAVIIVSHQSGAVLRRTVESVIDQLQANDQIVIWDNASDDSTRLELDKLARQWPSIHVQLSDENNGFSRAVNSAVRQLSDTYHILTLDPAIRAKDGAIRAMRRALATDEHVAAVGAIQLGMGEQTIDGVGDVYHMTGLPWRQGHGNSASMLSTYVGQQAPEFAEIFSPCSAFALYRRSAFDEMDGFDEDFFCCCEDIDLGFRLRLAGYKCVRANQAFAVHEGSSANIATSNFTVYHGQRNMVWTFFKDMPMPLLVVLLPLHLAMTVLLIMFYSLAGRPGIILKSKMRALSGLGKALKKRSGIHSRRALSTRQIWQMLNKSAWRPPPGHASR